MTAEVVKVPFSGIPVVFVGEWCVLDGASVSAETIVCKLVGHTPVDNHPIHPFPTEGISVLPDGSRVVEEFLELPAGKSGIVRRLAPIGIALPAGSQLFEVRDAVSE
jgi:hypothetical protein